MVVRTCTCANIILPTPTPFFLKFLSYTELVIANSLFSKTVVLASEISCYLHMPFDGSYISTCNNIHLREM